MSRTLLVCLALAIAGGSAASALQQNATASRQHAVLLERGRQHTAWPYAGRIDEIWPRLSSAFQEQMQSKERLAAFQQQITAQLGAERAVLDEQVQPSPGNDAYVRTATFERGLGKFEVLWSWDYACWNSAILAPADGTVVAAVDGVADNVPGVMNSDAPMGNHDAKSRRRFAGPLRGRLHRRRVARQRRAGARPARTARWVATRDGVLHGSD